MLTCRADGNFLRVSSDEAYDVALRYDTVEFWIHPSSNSFDSLASVKLSMRASSPNGTAEIDPGRPIPANVLLPVVVQRSKSRLAVRSLTSGSGAILVALPAVLGGASPLALRIVLAGLGAIILAVGTALLGSSAK